MKKKLLLGLLSIVFLIIMSFSVSALTPPSGGVEYWNFTNLTGLWNDNVLVNSGASSNSNYPVFNISGNSSPSSFYLDGINDKITRADDDTFDFGTGDFSFSLWVNIGAYSNNWLIHKSDQYNDVGWGIIMRGTNVLAFHMQDNLGVDFNIETSIPDLDTWYHMVVVIDRDNAGNSDFFWDGVSASTSTSGTIGNVVNISNSEPLEFFFTRQSGGTPLFMEGLVDEVQIFNRTLNITEVSNLYNYGSIEGETPTTSYPISWLSQYPADITDTNLFANNGTFNITYNTTISASNVFLNYTVERSDSDCLVVVNGSCLVANATYKTFNYSVNRSPQYDFLLDGDNDVYPGVFVIPESTFHDTVHSSVTLDNSNKILLSKFYGVSNETDYSYFEVMANDTAGSVGGLEIFYCNDSYSSGSIINSPYCVQFATIDKNTSYNHSHGSNSSHQLVPFTLIDGSINGVKVTSTSQFVYRTESNLGEWNIWYINSLVRTDTTRYSTNTGNGWSNQLYSVDAHLHQFGENDRIVYQGCITNSTATNCSSFITDTFDIDPLPPTSVVFNSPLATDSFNRTVFINYSNATFSLNTLDWEYLIYLADENGNTLNLIHNNSKNLSYSWDSFSQTNLSVDTPYRIRVVTNDLTYNLSSSTLSEYFTILYNGRIMFNATDYLTGASLINFTVESYENATYSRTNVSTTNGTIYHYLKKGAGYDFTLYARNYITSSYSLVPNTTYYNYTFTGYNAVSFKVMFVNEETLANITGVKFSVFNDYYSNTFNTGSNNSYFLEDLPEGEYRIRYNINSSSDYSRRDYYLFIPHTEEDKTEITLYSVNVNDSQLFVRTITDNNAQPLEGYYLELQRAYVSDDNTSFNYETVEIGKTNSQGEVVFSAIPNVQQYRLRVLDTDRNIVNVQTPTFLIDQFSNIIINLAGSLTYEIDTATGVRHTNISYHIPTSNFVFDYSAKGEASSVCLFMRYNYQFAENLTTVCSSNPGDTLTITAPNSSIGHYLVSAYAVVNGYEIIIDIYDGDLGFGITDIASNIGPIFYVLFMMLCATMTGFVRPEIGVGLAVIGTVFLSMSSFSVVSIGNLSAGALMLLGGIVIFLYRQREANS